MFIGPTGSGKSTIAHHIAAQARGPNSKVLKLDDASVSVASSKEIRHLVELLKPDVLLLDDIQERLAPLLEVLENVRGVFLVLTFMLDKKIDPKKPGALYFPGMRPGRVDHVFYIGLPDEAKRNEILRSYIKHIRDDYAEFLALSAGFPSAYLHKAALMYESQTWRDGLVHLIACAPDLGNSTPTSLS
jgi:SpoVK/Ycf46/Vps4 family AAA+-type ATPase